ncbi:twitching motility two-component system response regulator PilH [endosymbiont of unidentified scaly snail isolate Monju]|nr:twitching motility two-component system response regulator PilH [endosymbiont of unidentified scaly snail isolate Monju]
MKPRILIVEDSLSQRQTVCRQLARCHFDPVSAENGLEALRLARMQPPELILMDIDMPELDGLDTCRELQRDPLTRHIPVVMLSSCTEKSCQLRALMRGAIAYLTKPVTRAQLCHTMTRCLLQPPTWFVSEA